MVCIYKNIHICIYTVYTENQTHNMSAVSSVLFGADSFFNRSKGLLWRGGGGVRSVYIWLWPKGVRVVKHTFWRRLPASHKEQMSPLMILVLFYVWAGERIWVHKFSSENIKLSEGLFFQFSPEYRMNWSLPWIPFRVCWRTEPELLNRATGCRASWEVILFSW